MNEILLPFIKCKNRKKGKQFIQSQLVLLNIFFLIIISLEFLVDFGKLYILKSNVSVTFFVITGKQNQVLNYKTINLKKAKYLPVQKAKFIYHQPFYFEYNLNEDMNPLAYVGNNYSCGIMTVFADTFFF